MSGNHTMPLAERQIGYPLFVETLETHTFAAHAICQLLLGCPPTVTPWVVFRADLVLVDGWPGSPGSFPIRWLWTPVREIRDEIRDRKRREEAIAEATQRVREEEKHRSDAIELHDARLKEARRTLDELVNGPGLFGGRHDAFPEHSPECDHVVVSGRCTKCGDGSFPETDVPFEP